jgi:LruC domain-containing protein
MKRTLALALAAAALSPPAFAQDSDGDGAIDLADAYPCDATVAGLAYAPAQDQHAVLLFEDEWPDLGDADFNDAVVSYNYVVRTDAQGRAVAITATFNALALGGVFDNGLGLHLPVPAAAVASVTRTVGAGAPQALTPRAADTELTVTVSPNLRELFGGAAGQINAIDGAPLTGEAVQVDVALSAPTALSLGAAPFDVFLFRAADPQHEIHRTMFGGTAAMQSGLFGSRSDRSAPGRWFADGRGLPFVLDLPVYTVHPKEAVDVALLWPRILGFAASGGTLEQDFYTGDAVLAQAYSGAQPLQPVLLSGPPAPSGACISQPASYEYSGGIQTLIIPPGIRQVAIRAEGASGGPSNNHLGGLGAFAQGSFNVTEGDVLYILAGQAGMYWGGVGNWHAGTGGGASFVGRGASLATSAPLIVAGGGGGAAQSGPGESAAVLTLSGTGAGGTDGLSQGWSGASGGAGYHANGHHNGDHPTCVMGQPLKARAFISGGAGGFISNFGCGLPDTVRGGFGGGGCAGSYNGGGGGGYIGGNVNDLGLNRAGRAGTSFNAGTNATHGTLTARGNGRVSITLIGTPPPLAVDTTPLDVAPVSNGNTPGACTALAVTNGTSTTLGGLALGAFTGPDAAAFAGCSGVPSPCGATLAAGATCNFGVQLTATGNGAYSAVAHLSASGGHTASRAVQATATGFTVTGCTPGAGYPGLGSRTFTYTGVIESFQVPAGVCEITIRAEGASGGPSNNHPGGLGAVTQGVFGVTPGATLHVLVGQAGMYWGGVGNWHAGTGGGGSFVGLGASSATSTPLIVAGGGGGAAQASRGQDSAGVTPSGTGGGGTDGVNQGWTGASGGAGWHADGGHHGDHPTCVKGQPLKAQAFVRGGAGGYISNFGCGLPNTVRGGFGGGGCAGSANGGGGGGYVGGNVNDLGLNLAGRAGTSYNAGLAATYGTRTASGDGTVTISW